ncbi:MAG TPA: MBOAT family O-acyltransferase [Pirellulales bacterium]|jgi:D-alanyl-lipoteichoic acid acyltransferase DltB (MBOAT superfamily)|nr:MBOAT family O-acyltransferase [Pirellulales bacterium]
MGSSGIDLYKPAFWLVAGLAIVLLTGLKNAKARKCVFALANLGFIGLHVSPPTLKFIALSLAGLVAAAVVVCTLLRMVEAGYVRLPLAAGGIAVLALFVLHKMPSIVSTGGALPLNSLLITIGFSYVALRLVDLGRAVADGDHPAPDPIALINYALPFHMLAAGPIQAYADFTEQPGVPPASTASTSLRSIDRLVGGLFKKYILANFIEKMFLTGFRADGPYFLLEAQLNYIWVYLDFSAYSDIALGLGGLMGVATPVNFNRPYVARNVIDYWERWHISLSTFIRRNLFIPIQLKLMRMTGGRFALTIASFAFFVSFALCGLWHSISMPWLAWGVLQATGLIVCNLYKAALMKRLGRRGVNAYLANPWIRVVATVLTFEFIAATLVVVMYPYAEMQWWVD